MKIMKVLGITAALAVAFATTHQAHAVPVEYSFEGHFEWDGLQGSPAPTPDQARVDFSGTASLEDGLNFTTGLNVASFDTFTSLTIGTTTFDLSNIVTLVVDSASHLSFRIGGAGASWRILGNTDDFGVEFRTSGAMDFTSSADLISMNVVNPGGITVANSNTSIKNPDFIGGFMQFNRVLDPIDPIDPPVSVPTPATAPLLLAGLAALGFARRIRTRHIV